MKYASIDEISRARARAPTHTYTQTQACICDLCDDDGSGS